MQKMIKNLKKRNHHKKAFSLIEMSIVLLIVAIIVSGMLTISTASITNEKTRVTKERIDEIYKALGRFLLTNYRLPCPASLISVKNTAGYGTASGTPGTCVAAGLYNSTTLSTVPIYGMVPVKTLGLSDEFGEDGFGSKLAYIVYQEYTLAEYPTATDANGFSYTVVDAAMPAAISMPSATISSGNAFVIISFGPNKYGAFNANAAAQIPSAGASTYELQNMLSSINDPSNAAAFGIVAANAGILTFTSAESDSEVFDDIVFYKTRDQIITDANATFLIPCISPATGFVGSYYGKTQYRSTACTPPDDNIIPTEKCSLFGAWITETTCP